MPANFKNPDSLITCRRFIKIADRYLNSDLIPSFQQNYCYHWLFDRFTFPNRDGVQILGIFLDDGDPLLRMFGSAQELTKNFKIFRSFPHCHYYFKCRKTEAFNSKPIYLKNQKNQDFICQMDMLVEIQTRFLGSHENFTEPHVGSTIAYFLKSQGDRLKTSYHLIPFNKTVIDDIEMEYMLISSHHQRTYDRSKRYLKSFSLENCIELWRTILPEWEEGEFELVKEGIELDLLMYSENPLLFEVHFVLTKLLLGSLKKSIDSRPEIFWPLNDQPKNKKSNIPTVRVFKDGDRQFLMKNELDNAFHVVKYGKTLRNSTRFIYAVELEEAKQKYGEQMEPLELLSTTINRAKHAATPVITHYGEFCILAADALLEVFRVVIFKHKVFQRMSIFGWSVADRFLAFLREHIDFQCESQYFINMETVEKMKDHAKIWHDLEERTSAKDVRNAKKDGFTLQNLKNELAHLELTSALSSITDHAEIAYETVMKNKKEKFLRTSDLFDAIEQCQLICIFNRYSEIKRFLHYQNACQRIPGLGCHICNGSPEVDVIPPSMIETIQKKYREQCKDPPSSDNAEERAGNSETPNSETFSKNSVSFDEMKKEMETMKIKLKIASNLRNLSEEENEKLKKQVSEKSSASKEVNSLKSKLAKVEAREEKLKDSKDALSAKIKKLEETNKSQIEEIESLTAQLELKNVETSEKNRLKSDELKTIRKSINGGNQLEIANEMMELLITESNHEAIRKMAKYEMMQYESQYRKYLQAIEKNIEKLENSETSTDLPNFPSFSDRILQEYWKLVESENIKEPEMDLECLICHDDMVSKREKLAKCENCKRHFHVQCISEWLQRKRVCPVCNHSFSEF